jgi:magnesium-transporting ATPase (P-type)
VPKAIQSFHLADIDIWMLTGDKMETAENIAKTCGLINPAMLVKNCKTDLDEGGSETALMTNVLHTLEQIRTDFDSTDDKTALVIDGNSLQYILFDPNNHEKVKQHPELSTTESLTLVENCKKIFIQLS